MFYIKFMTGKRTRRVKFEEDNIFAMRSICAKEHSVDQEVQLCK